MEAIGRYYNKDQADRKLVTFIHGQIPDALEIQTS